MSLKFYYKQHSTSDLTVAVLAELEHGLPEPIAERTEVDLQKGESRTPEYLSEVNPNGLVPAIVHNGVSIWESAAITMYLGEVFGVERTIDGKKVPALYPPVGTSRGEAMKWLVWTSTHLGAKGIELHAAQNAKSEDRIQSALEGLKDKVRILDDALQKRDYILGTEYSLVDTHLWSAVAWLTFMGLELEAFPGLSSWKQKIEQRPAIRSLDA